MSSKPKKPEDYILPLAAGLAFVLTSLLIGALGTDLYHAAQFVGDLYGKSI